MTDAADAAVGDVGPDACVPPTNEDLCALAGAQCSAITLEDECGTRRTADCGGCGGNDVCNVSTRSCCVPESDESFCVRYNAACGSVTGADNCAQTRTVDCPNTCANPDDCNGTTCGMCVRETDATFCGRHNYSCGELSSTDNCGQSYTTSCGTCMFGANCVNGFCDCPGGDDEANCLDGADNDCDGLTDCEDPNCDGQKCGGGIGDLAPRCRDGDCKAL